MEGSGDNSPQKCPHSVRLEGTKHTCPLCCHLQETHIHIGGDVLKDYIAGCDKMERGEHHRLETCTY